jgi:carboxyl-terminal processing protease
MMLASNNGVGMNIGFPDVCLTPAAPAPIPIPYPNLAMNAMAVPFSPNIFVGFMPSVTMASTIPMTNGDEAGVAHPLFKQMGMYTMGNPTILVNCVPAINMLCPTTGNMMNNPVGAALVPSVTTTFYTDAALASGDASAMALDREALARLREVSSGVSEEVSAELVDGVAWVRVRRFSSCTATRVFSALRGLEPPRALVFDLRGNPGGDVDGCTALLEDLVPRGSVMVIREDRDGDRAGLVERTAGKATAQQVRSPLDGSGRVYTDVARFVRHDGVEIHGVGVTPDAPLSGGIDEALRVARGLAGGV